jgi:hypothetical protein
VQSLLVFRASIVSIATVVVALACGEGEAQPLDVADFLAFAEERNQCLVDADCTLAGQSCVGLCGVPVHVKFAKAVEAEAKKYDAMPGGIERSCFLHCGVAQVICSAGRCEQRDVDESNALLK